jgi:hypothetical protein
MEASSLPSITTSGARSSEFLSFDGCDRSLTFARTGIHQTLSIYLQDISSDRSPQHSAAVMLSQDAIIEGAHRSRSFTAIAPANAALRDTFAMPAN